MGQGRDDRPRQVDLSNGRGIRFGAQCVICSARYATPLQPLAPDTSERELREVRDDVGSAFTAAWHELEIQCYRCGRPACPLCWDADNHMCAECVAEHGLARAPFRGVGASGPLADGRLQVMETGRYSDVARPAWLGDLLGAPEGGGAAARAPGDRPATGDDPVRPWMQAAATTGNLARGAYPGAPYAPANSNTVAASQTTRMPAPAAMDEPIPIWQQPTRRDLGGDAAARIPNQEGAATSTMVECPRCGTENYDFVTRCTVCQLQLIQICPLCEKLNPGQATRCEFCGSPLNRPRGWSGVANQQRITATSLASDERQWGEAQAAQAREAAARGGPSAPGVSGDLAWQAAGYAPPAVAPLPALTPPPAKVPPPPRRLGRRRTAAPVAMPAPEVPPAGDADPSASVQDPYALAPDVGERRSSFAAVLTERAISLALTALIAVILGLVVAAELSAQANDAVRAVTHVDVRQTLGSFVHQIELILQRNSR
jgi:hypothetical protein